ncbi:MAG: hypothetical protein KBT07_07145 [Clostridiales bacterium]|nr:hypothetical protein [Candidatus Scatonaster coprocaballi]
MKKYSIHNSAVEQYIRLIVKRDQLQKDACFYEEEYLRVFGDEMLSIYEEKIKCIELRKKIHYCQVRTNHQEKVDRAEMERMIRLEMSEYYDHLRRMQKDVKDARDTHEVAAYLAMEAKRYYRNIAKLIHPDVLPLAKEDEYLKDIWERVVKAYRRLAADELADLELLAIHYLEEHGIKTEANPQIEDVEQKIERVRNQINRIINTDPYQYRELFARPELVDERHEELIDEMLLYQHHREELEKMLNLFLGEGDVTILWDID